MMGVINGTSRAIGRACRADLRIRKTGYYTDCRIVIALIDGRGCFALIEGITIIAVESS